MEVRMDLAQIRISESHDQQVIVLRERNGARLLQIVIGLTEALAIDRRVKSVQRSTPVRSIFADSIGVFSWYNVGRTFPSARLPPFGH